jgi:hypothetical protein
MDICRYNGELAIKRIPSANTSPASVDCRGSFASFRDHLLSHHGASIVQLDVGVMEICTLVPMRDEYYQE